LYPIGDHSQEGSPRLTGSLDDVLYMGITKRGSLRDHPLVHCPSGDAIQLRAPNPMNRDATFLSLGDESS